MAQTPSVRNGIQDRENIRNNTFLNYKSAAPNQVSYAGISTYESCFQWVDSRVGHDLFRAAPQKGPNFHGIFLRHEEWFRTPGGGVVSFNTLIQRLDW